MEFYVVDPKDFSFPEWTVKIREFLEQEKLSFNEEDGHLYYQGDDIAAAWDEDSVVFTVQDEETAGLVELRDADRHFYVFADDLDLFDDKEVRDALGMVSKSAGALYGFSWRNAKKCRFHLGPSVGFNYFCNDDEADYPGATDLEEVWSTFFRAAAWIGDMINRIQDLRGIEADDVNLDFETRVTFTHPASLDGLNEILVEEEGYERTKDGLHAIFRDRSIAWIKQFTELLPPDDEDFNEAFFRAVWRGQKDGEPVEVFSVGVERRNLRPFIQLPVYRTSKALMERFRAHFKGHRIDRQEYYL